MSLLLLFSNGVLGWTRVPANSTSWNNDDYDLNNTWGEWESTTWDDFLLYGQSWNYMGGYTFINAVPGPNRLMPVGDSITFGTTDPNLFGYRDHLQDFLGIGTYDIVGYTKRPASNATYDVEVSATGGFRTLDVLGRISLDLFNFMPKPNGPSSKLLLFIGTNDSAGSTPGFPPPPVLPAVAAARVASIINRIKSYDSSISIYVALIIPHRGAGSVKNNPNFIAYNSALSATLTTIMATNSNVHMVNMYTAYTEDTFGLLSGSYLTKGYAAGDDTHPSELGYTVIATAWAAAITTAEPNITVATSGNTVWVNV